jgi:hypothetical protein
MSPDVDHYTFLGVPPQSSSGEVAAAVQARARQADSLEASNPAQAQLIRDRVQQVRQDLLTSPQRRAAYDRHLLGGAGAEPTIVSPIGSPEPVRRQPPPQYTSVMQQGATEGASTSLISSGPSPRWLIALAVLLALIIGGAVVYGAMKVAGQKSASSPTAVPTHAPRPTKVPKPTSTTAAPTAAPTSVPTAAPTSVPPTNPPVDPLAADEGTIKAKGYTPAGGHAETQNGSGGTLYAWIGTCTGSADGHCQKVFFFNGTTYLGTDTSADSAGIMSVDTRAPEVFAVTYANYKPNDPLCCPTGTPVTITYRWTGSRLIPSGTPPGH